MSAALRPSRPLQPANCLVVSRWIGALHHGRGTIEHRGELLQLRRHRRGVVLVDGFIHRRDHYCGVAGVLARRIDGVAVPRAIRQSLLQQERALGAAEDIVQSRCICAFGLLLLESGSG